MMNTQPRPISKTNPLDEPVSYHNLCVIALEALNTWPEEKTRNIVDSVHDLKTAKKQLIDAINEAAP